MKTTIRLAAVAVATLAIISVAGAKGEPGVAGQLKGKLVELKEGKIADAEISADMEYYVLYHSASW